MKKILFYFVALLSLTSAMAFAQVTDSTDQEDQFVPPLEQDQQDVKSQDQQQENAQEQPQVKIQDLTEPKASEPQKSKIQEQPQSKPQDPLPVQRQQNQQVQTQLPPVRETIKQSPMFDERPVTSAPTNVKMTTPVISIDLIMDLYNKDIDFDIDYNGAAGAGISSLGKKRPNEQEVEKMVTEQSDPESIAKTGKTISDTKEPPREDGSKPYSPEDANYNKAMISLNNAQQLFAARRYTESLSEINRSISFAPNIALSHSVKGSVHYMLRQVSEAKKSWERALELDPTLDNVRAILLRMY